jgi:arabinofuranosyltransferase
VHVLPVGLLAARAWSRRWVTEDAFINFRIVDVTLRGRQPFAFNVGERVEAGTSPLWIATLVVLEATLGPLIDLEWLALLVGLGLTLIGMAAALDASLVLLRRTGTAGWHWPAGAIVLAVLPPMWDFATSGMETGLTFAWLGGCYWLLARRYADSFDAGPTQRPPPTSPRWLPVVLGLGPLIRPDLFLFTLAFMVAHLVLSRPGMRDRLSAIAGALVLPAAFQVFRMAYFAALVPNTALVKEAGTANWTKGLAYLENYAGTYWLVVPAVVAVGWAALWLQDAAKIGGHRLVILVAAPAAAALVHAAYVTRVGGDFMHGRLLLPATFGLFMAGAALPVVRAGAPGATDFRVGRIAATAVAAGALTAWAVACGTRLRVTDRPPARWSDILDERVFWQGQSGRRNAVTLDDYRCVDSAGFGRRARQLAALGADVLIRIDGTEQSLAPRSGVILEAITIGLGSQSAGPGVHVADVLGLGDAVGSRIPAEPRGRIGHQKRLPRALMFARIAGASDDDLPHDVDHAALEAARRTLRSPAVAGLLDATQEPLTPLRALRNLLRSPALTRLRVPAGGPGR